MNCKKLVIETDGTSANTKIFADDKQLSGIHRFEFFANVDETFTRITMESVMLNSDGKPKTKKTKERDKNQKFVEKETPIVEPILVEFSR